MWSFVWKRWHATSLHNGHCYCLLFVFCLCSNQLLPHTCIGTYNVIWCIMPSEMQLCVFCSKSNIEVSNGLYLQMKPQIFVFLNQCLSCTFQSDHPFQAFYFVEFFEMQKACYKCSQPISEDLVRPNFGRTFVLCLYKFSAQKNY